MQARIEHEFTGEENQAMIRLAGGLSRFSLVIGGVGLALVGLGVTAIVTGGYQSELAGPSVIILGLVSVAGGALFMRPRVSLDLIARSRGGDVTRLLDALTFLDRAHGVFRVLLVAFVLVRLASFALVRLG